MNFCVIVYKCNATETIKADRYEQQGNEYVFLVTTYDKKIEGIVRRIPVDEVKRIEKI